MTATTPCMILALPLLAFLGACQDRGWTIEEICDGSEDIRLTAVWRSNLEGWLEEAQAARGMVYENGTEFFYVTGECEFGVGGDRFSLGPDRGGTLTAEDAATLAEDLYFGSWGTLEGKYSNPSVHDGTVLRLRDGEHEVSCYAGCDAPGVPGPVPRMFDAAVDWEARFHEVGALRDGDLRVSAELPASQDGPVFNGLERGAWPLEWSLASIALPEDAVFEPGAGTLVTGEEADELREFWLDHRERNLQDVSIFGAMLVEADGTLYWVHVRDALPMEDATGLAPWSPHLPDDGP